MKSRKQVSAGSAEFSSREAGDPKLGVNPGAVASSRQEARSRRLSRKKCRPVPGRATFRPEPVS
ncbi:MAG TPA: hypothetical protein DCE07_01040 [Peptococcaceae bacterium]|nr:hypothetical protein [Peptococcaceae bacterium]